MKTMIYLVEGVEPGECDLLTQKEQEFLNAIDAGKGTSVDDLVKALGEPVNTNQTKSKFYNRLLSLVEKGFIKTKTITLGLAA